MSRHETSFAAAAAPAMVDWFGRNDPDNTVHTSLADIETALGWIVVGDEERRVRKTEHKVEVYYQTEGWLIVDNAHSHFSGITLLQLNERITIDDKVYIVAWSKIREGNSIVDFRLERVARQETARIDLRGR